MNQLPNFRDVRFSVIDRDGGPWVTSTDLAAALGYSRPDKITQLYQRNHSEFTDKMTQIARLNQGAHPQYEDVPTSTGQSDTRIFSLRGAHLVAMFAKTPVAAEFRRWVLDVLDAMAAVNVPATPESGVAAFHGRIAAWLALRDHATNYDLADAFSIDPMEGGLKGISRIFRLLGWRRAWVRGPDADPRTARRAAAPALADRTGGRNHG